jgi:hypothetical protein
MAQNTNVFLTPNVWTQLTDSDVSSITFQNRTAYPILVKGTAGATAPTDDTGAIRYNAGQGELNALMIDLFPGISATRLWALSEKSNTVMVSHA